MRISFISVFFSVSLLCLSALLFGFKLTFVSMFGFSLLFFFLLSRRIALSSDFEFDRSSFTGALSALTAAVLLKRQVEVSTFFTNINSADVKIGAVNIDAM